MTDLSSRRYDEALELMFYGFKRLVEAPDRVLAARGLGRAHHRILYFVARRPGCTVGELLALLEVTKQSLNRPLRELLTGGLVRHLPDPRDGRIRRLELSLAGRSLESRLTDLQHRHFAQVFRRVGADSVRGWGDVMRELGRPEPISGRRVGNSASGRIRSKAATA